LVCSASRIGTNNSPGSFGLSTVTFLLSRLSLTLNEIPHFFFSFHLMKMISYLCSILKSMFGFWIEHPIFAFDFSINLSIFVFWIDLSIVDFSFDLSIGEEFEF
jgi:hypothetical protein